MNGAMHPLVPLLAEAPFAVVDRCSHRQTGKRTRPGSRLNSRSRIKTPPWRPLLRETPALACPAGRSGSLRTALERPRTLRWRGASQSLPNHSWRTAPRFRFRRVDDAAPGRSTAGRRDQSFPKMDRSKQEPLPNAWCATVKTEHDLPAGSPQHVHHQLLGIS
jgi:hypothetical protein